MTTIDWTVEQGIDCQPQQRLYDLAKDLYIAEGGNKPPHRCINDACLFLQEWRAFLGLDSVDPRQGPDDLQGGP